MKTKQVRQEEAIARNEKHRAKYLAQWAAEHPNVKEGSAKEDDTSSEYADRKIGIPARRR